MVVASITHARMSLEEGKKRKKRKKEGKRKKGGFLFPYDFDRMSAFLLLGGLHVYSTHVVDKVAVDVVRCGHRAAFHDGLSNRVCVVVVGNHIPIECVTVKINSICIYREIIYIYITMSERTPALIEGATDWGL